VNRGTKYKSREKSARHASVEEQEPGGGASQSRAYSSRGRGDIRDRPGEGGNRPFNCREGKKLPEGHVSVFLESDCAF